MSVTGYVGLPGSGKTLQLVARVLDARKHGRDVYANFGLGTRAWGYLAPTCEHDGCAAVDGWHTSTAHDATSYKFVRDSAESAYVARWFKWRRGRGFVADPGVTVMTSWEQIIAVRVMRDELGTPHRTRVVEGEDGSWSAVRDCPVWNCAGCSKGATVAIDELNLWAPSRMWQELGIGVLNRWAYNRKDGLEILWTAQHEARVDKVAREVTDFIWNCKCLGGVVSVLGRELHLQVFHRSKWIPALLTETNRTDAQEGVKNSGLTDFEFSFFHQKVADAYDTYEHVAVNQELAAATSRRREGGGRARSAAPALRVVDGR